MCPNCKQPLFIHPQYKDNLCKNNSCPLYLKGDVFSLSPKEDALSIIMDNFDFDQVHSVMTFLNWRWHHLDGTYSIPSLQAIKDYAKDQLLSCTQKAKNSNTPFTISSGGFSSHYDPQEDFLNLSFILEEFSN